MHIFHSLKKTVFYSIVFSFILNAVFFVPSISAQGTGVSSGIQNPLSSGTLVGFLQGVLSVLIKFAIPIAALAIIYSGFLFVSSRGNETKLLLAKKTLLYAVIGTAVLLGAQVIIFVIATTVQSL